MDSIFYNPQGHQATLFNLVLSKSIQYQSPNSQLAWKNFQNFGSCNPNRFSWDQLLYLVSISKEVIEKSLSELPRNPVIEIEEIIYLNYLNCPFHIGILGNVHFKEILVFSLKMVSICSKSYSGNCLAFFFFNLTWNLPINSSWSVLQPALGFVFKAIIKLFYFLLVIM